MTTMKSVPVSRRTRSAYGCRTADGLGAVSADDTSGDAATLLAIASTRSLVESWLRGRSCRYAAAPPANTTTATTTTCSANSWRARLQARGFSRVCIVQCAAWPRLGCPLLRWAGAGWLANAMYATLTRPRNGTTVMDKSLVRPGGHFAQLCESIAPGFHPTWARAVHADRASRQGVLALHGGDRVGVLGMRQSSASR